MAKVLRPVTRPLVAVAIMLYQQLCAVSHARRFFLSQLLVLSKAEKVLEEVDWLITHSVETVLPILSFSWASSILSHDAGQ